MKRISILLLLAAVALSCFGNTQRQEEKIRMVAEGTLKEADASWWGFDDNDATECLQQAMKSGVPKLRVPNLGKPWLISKRIYPVSDQEVIFEKGVQIQAKEDAFHERWTGLFFFQAVKNTTFRGEGEVVLSMRIDDYNDQKKYTLSEWRHGMYFIGSDNIVIRDMTIKDTGGDGIAIGSGTDPTRNMLIENILFDNCNRLGIGMVCGENITIRNCVFMNAHHMPPRGGVDLEPNLPEERISNILIENCEFKNNKGYGFTLALGNLDLKSPPVSVIVRNCKVFEGNTLGMDFQAFGKRNEPAHGSLTVENCHFRDCIDLTNCIEDVFSITLKDVEFAPFEPKKSQSSAPHPVIAIESKGTHGMKIGGIHFDNVRITNPFPERAPLTLSFYGRASCENPIDGTIFLNDAPLDYAPMVLEKCSMLKKFNSLVVPASPDFSDFREHGIKQATIRGNMPLRKDADLLIKAQKGQTVVYHSRIINFYPATGEINIYDPDGEFVEKVKLPYTNDNWVEHSFVAKKKGIYRLRCRPSINTVEARADLPHCYLAPEGSLTLLQPSGYFYFVVPARTSEFSLSISGSPNVSAEIYNPKGQSVLKKRDISSLDLLNVKCKPSSKPEIWSIHLSSVVWETTLNVYEPLQPVFCENPRNMLIVPRKSQK